MKKIAALLSMILLTTNVSAGQITEFEKDIVNSTVVIKGEGCNPGEMIGFRVCYPGVASVIDGKQTNTIVYMGEAKAQDDGTVACSVLMPESTNKEIIDFVVYMSGAETSEVLKYIDNDGLEQSLSNIKDADSSDTILNELNSITEAIDIKLLAPWYNFEQTSKDWVIQVIFNQKDKYASLDEVCNDCDFGIFQEALRLTVSDTEFITVFDKYKDLADANLFDDVYINMSESIENSFKTILFNARTRFDGTPKTFNSEFKKAILLAEINKLDRSAALVNVLNSYADVITNEDSAMSSVMESYKNGIETKRLEVCDAILEARPSSIKDLSDIIKGVMNKTTNNNVNSTAGRRASSKSSGGITTGSYVFDTPSTAVNPPQQSVFSDIEKEHFAYDAINYLAQNNVINGYSENGKTVFKPNASVTREEFVKMIFAAFDFEIQNCENEFDDVEDSGWYKSYVLSATKYGIIKGIENRQFGTGLPVSREDLCTIIYRAAVLKELSFSDSENSVKFADEADISEYAKEAVEKHRCAGFVSGDENGRFNPKAGATRGEVAKIMYNILKNKENVR